MSSLPDYFSGIFIFGFLAALIAFMFINNETVKNSATQGLMHSQLTIHQFIVH